MTGYLDNFTPKNAAITAPLEASFNEGLSRIISEDRIKDEASAIHQ
jgi:hypothetical protein